MNVDACDSNRKQPDGSQDGIPTADIVRHYESLEPTTIRIRLQRTFFFICCGKNALFCTLFTVFFHQKILEYAECDGGLCCCTGFGNHIDANIFTATNLEKIIECRSTDVVPGEVDSRCTGIATGIIIGRLQKFDSCTGTEIGTADAQYNKHITGFANLFCSRFNSRKFFLIIGNREIQPAEIIGSVTSSRC